MFSKQDLKLLSYAQKWIRNSEAQITVLDATGQLESYPEFKEQIRLIEQFKPNHIRIVNAKEVNNEFVKDFNLMLISLESWKTLVEERKTWLNSAPSMLLIQL